MLAWFHVNKQRTEKYNIGSEENQAVRSNREYLHVLSSGKRDNLSNIHGERILTFAGI